jgi:hypothetical protein
MPSRRRHPALFFIAAASLFNACEAGTIDAYDAASDAGSERGTIMDTGTTFDAPPPPIDVTPTDTGTAPVDSGPRDTGAPPPTDTGPRDTGPTYCPTTCTTDTECQSMCPAPSAGYRYCCQYGSGGGSCSQRASACDGSGTTAGTLGAACHMDSECNVAPANCCLTVGSAGTCGCAGSFGCMPASFCM